MITDNLELTIERIKIDGPIVRKHNSRKESDHAEPMTNERLISNYEKVRGNNLKALKELAE